MRIGSLCTGYGGLDLAAEAVTGGTVAWVSDTDKGSRTLLAHRYPGVPNLGDFTRTDWTTVEPVDALTAGFPCQPVSNAGQRRGDLDERWLWDDVAAAIGALRPRLVLLENVRGLLTAGNGRLFGRVLGSLAHLGYDADWHGIRASDVGAPHRRWRVFIVAHPQRGRLHRRPRKPQRHPLGRAPAPGSGPGPLLPTPAVNDMGAGKTVEAWDAWTDRMKAAHGNGNGHGASLAIETQRPGMWGTYAEAIQRWETIIGRPAPEPTQPSRTGKPQLAAPFVEWMMGLPEGWVTDVPGLTRNQMLKLCGNGVVPQQAIAAIRGLLP